MSQVVVTKELAGDAVAKRVMGALINHEELGSPRGRNFQDEGSLCGSAVVIRHIQLHHVVAGCGEGVRAGYNAGREDATRALDDRDRPRCQGRVIAPVDRRAESLDGTGRDASEAGIGKGG